MDQEAPFLAGLQNVPRVYQEAAEIDGANAWNRFWHITVPCMTPIIFYNLIMSLVTNLQVVTPALTLTNGGPGNSSRFISYVMYQYDFKGGKYGYACAISPVLFLTIAAFPSLLFLSSIVEAVENRYSSTGKMGRGLRCRPWRATARLRPPPRRTPFFLAFFLPILNRIDYKSWIYSAGGDD